MAAESLQVPDEPWTLLAIYAVQLEAIWLARSESSIYVKDTYLFMSFRDGPLVLLLQF